MIRPRTMARFPLLATALLLGLAPAADASAAEVRIEVEDVLGDQGSILVSLCDPETFLTAACPYRAMIPARDGKVVVTVPDVAPGPWAAMAFHDQNGNLKFDTGSGGVPIEGYGFSNDALAVRFGPPEYEDAELTVREGMNVISIFLAY